MATNPTSATVKALAHPIRVEIIRAIANGVTTPKAMAERIGEPLGLVSYHARMLRQYGVIEVSRTEPRRGALAHFYAFTPAAVSDLRAVAALASDAVRSATEASF